MCTQIALEQRGTFRAYRKFTDRGTVHVQCAKLVHSTGYTLGVMVIALTVYTIGALAGAGGARVHYITLEVRAPVVQTSLQQCTGLVHCIL